MTSEEERITKEFTSVPEAIQWLESSFAPDGVDAAAPRVADSAAPRWSLFGACMRPTAEEEELEVSPEEEVAQAPAYETVASDPPGSPSAPSAGGRGILEEDAQVQYMWADARVLPLKMMQELSRHNPARWSTLKSPSELADELDALGSMRPVLLSMQRKSGHLERHFHSARAAAQWLRQCTGTEVQQWDEERLCVICLTEPRNVMLMPCRHAVLCEHCLEILMERSPSVCPVCRKRIQNHARGHFVDDYVELIRALEMQMERSQMAAYEGMYNHIRPLMVTGVLLASGAAACFVICPPAAPALLAGAGVVGYLPWFATTVANFEQESTEERTHRIFTPEDYAHPLALVGKGVVLLVAAPVALTVFFIPYGLYAGVLRPLSRLVAQGLLRGACAAHVYLLRPACGLIANGCQLMLDGTVAAGNFLGDVLGVTAQAFYDAVLAPTWSGLRWLGGHLAWAAESSWNVVQSWGAVLWQGMEYVGSSIYQKVLMPAGQILSTCAEGVYAWVLVPMGQLALGAVKGLCKGVLAVSSGLWNYVLVPSASVTWQGLKMLGNGLSMAAELAYGYVLQPLPGGLYSYVFLPIGWTVSKLATGTVYAFGAAATAVAKLAEGCFNYVLQPCFSACSYVVSGLVSVLSTAAAAGYNYILLPVASAAAFTGQAIYTYVLVPCGTAAMTVGRFLVQVSTSAGETLYLYVLCPVGRGSRAAMEALRQCGEAIKVTFQGLVRT